MAKQEIKGSNRLAKNKMISHLFRQLKNRCRKIVHVVGQLLLSCGIVFLLLFILFQLLKGPAYISFREDKTKQIALSGLYSQCIYLQADRITADICGNVNPSTKITGTCIELSSDSLDSLLKKYLEQAGASDAGNIRLRMEDDQPYEISLTYKGAGGTVRYMAEKCDTAYIDPTQSSVFRCSFGQMQIYPGVTNGEAYESFVMLLEDIVVCIPTDADVCCYIVYDDSEGTDKYITIDEDKLPDHCSVSDKHMWAFTLHDTSLRVQSADETLLQMEIGGRYGLKMSCIGAGRITGYLTGEMLFQNTNTPKNYELMGQYVDIGSQDNALNVALCTDSRIKPQIEKELLINGEATRMDISGVNPFPDMWMWFRENVYMAPVSLLSVVINMYGLSRDKGSRKVHPRRIRQRNLSPHQSRISGK